MDDKTTIIRPADTFPDFDLQDKVAAEPQKFKSMQELVKAKPEYAYIPPPQRATPIRYRLPGNAGYSPVSPNNLSGMTHQEIAEHNAAIDAKRAARKAVRKPVVSDAEKADREMQEWKKTTQA